MSEKFATLSFFSVSLLERCRHVGVVKAEEVHGSLDSTERLERLTLSGGSRRASFGVPALGAQFPGYIIEQAVNTQRCRDKRLLVTIIDHDF